MIGTVKRRAGEREKEPKERKGQQRGRNERKEGVKGRDRSE